MLEPRRSRYLRALGIDVYVPRAILPGALPSVACEWEVASAPVVAAGATGPQAVAELIAESVPVEPPAQVVAAPARSLAPEIELPAARRAAEPAAVPAKAAAAADTAPRIALGIAVGGGILMIDDAPANAAERGDFQRLLGNVLFALRGDGAPPALDVFLWPMLKQPQLDRSADAARETLAAHIQNQIDRHAVHTVLLLGSAAQQWVQVDNAALRCVHSVSALGCLRQPADKRQLWHDIRHLAAVH